MTQLESNLITMMAVPGLGYIALVMLEAWRDRKKSQASQKRLYIGIDMASKPSAVYQQRIHLRNDLEKLHTNNLNAYGSNISKPKQMIYVLSKSVDEAIELMAKHNIQPTNLYLNYDIDNNNHNTKVFKNFMFRLEYENNGQTEFVGYYYNPLKNFNYCKIKLVEEFKKMKAKYPQYKFTTSFRTIRVKNKELL